MAANAKYTEEFIHNNFIDNEILDLNDLKDFTEDSDIQSNSCVTDTKLQKERQLALDLLRKSNSLISKSKYLAVPTKSNLQKYSKNDHLNEYSLEKNNSGKCFPSTSYEESLNLSDITGDHTIDIQITPKSDKNTFDPSEILGRSTLISDNDKINRVKEYSYKTTPSIDDILSGSMHEDVRSLRASLSFSSRDSFIRTADISKCSVSDSMINEFRPANEMNSLFASAENECIEKNAIIPRTNLIDYDADFTYKSFDTSASAFFKQTPSDSLTDFLPHKSPIKKATPKPLIDTDSETGSGRSDTERDNTLEDIDYYLSKYDLQKLSPNDLVEKITKQLNKKKKSPQKNHQLSNRNSNIEFQNKISLDLSDLDKENVRPKRFQSTFIDEGINNIDSLLGSMSFISPTRLSTNTNKTENDKVVASKTYNITISDQGIGSMNDEKSHNTNEQSKSTLKLQQTNNQSNPRKRSRSNLDLSTETKNNCEKDEGQIHRSRSPVTRHELDVVSGVHEKPRDLDLKHLKSSGLLKAAQSSPHIRDITQSPRSQKYQETKLRSKSVRSPTICDTGKYSLPSNFGINYEENASKPNSPNRLHLKNQLLSNISDEVFPIKSSQQDISWTCTRLRNTVEKTIRIKNMSLKKLTVKLKISGPGFQLLNIEQNGIISFQGLECRIVTCSFCPTVIGSAAGELIIELVNNSSMESRKIPLYGFGGHVNLHLQNVQCGPSENFFITLGDLVDLKREISTSFIVENRGNIPAFCMIEIQRKIRDMNFSGTSSLTVEPQKLIISPKSSREIKITFNARRDEIKKIIRSNLKVLPIADLGIVYGEEATRHRVKRLIKTAKQNDRAQYITQLNDICTSFTREFNIDDVEQLKDGWKSYSELVESFRHMNLTLTINNNRLDESTVEFSSDVDDESILFRTIVHKVDDEPYMESYKSNTNSQKCTHSRRSGETWSVFPTHLEITPNHQRNNVKILKIHSKFFSTQLYQINSNITNLFSFSPGEGEIKSGQELSVACHIDYNVLKKVSEPIFIHIYIENDGITVPVYVKY